MSEQGKIIDVSQLFAIRGQLHEGDEVRLNESEAAASALAGHRTRIMNIITAYSPEAAAKIYSAWQPQLRVSLTLPESEEAATERRLSVGADEDFEIGYRNHNQPHMFIGVGALKYTAKLFDVLLHNTANNADERRQNCIEAASVVLGALAMGKWAYDVLDPADRSLRSLNLQALQAVADISLPGTKLPPLPPLHDGNDLDTEEEQMFAESVRSVLSVARYRHAGRLAYDTLMLYGHERQLQSGLSAHNLNLFSGLYRLQLESQDNIQQASALQIALSYPIADASSMKALYDGILAL